MEEALAIWEAIVTIIQKQLMKIIIEIDSFVAIKAINGEINSNSYRNIVEDIIILSLVVKDIKFVHCSRLANSLANMIAKNAHLSCN